MHPIRPYLPSILRIVAGLWLAITSLRYAQYLDPAKGEHTLWSALPPIWWPILPFVALLGLAGVISGLIDAYQHYKDYPPPKPKPSPSGCSASTWRSP